MRKKTVNIVIFSLVVVLIVAIAIYLTMINQTKRNADGTVGNLAGNLYNGGLFAQNDDTVYFANSFDANYLYQMKADESQIHRLNLVTVNNILTAGNRIYYFQPTQTGTAGFGFLTTQNAFYLSDLNGNNVKELYRGFVVRGQLLGNSLYLLTGSLSTPTLYEVPIDGSKERFLSDSYVDPSCVIGNAIYFCDYANNFTLNALTDPPFTIRTVESGYSFWSPIAEGDYLYYMDPLNNYRLCRYSIHTGEAEFLTQERIDCFNLSSGYLYYQTNDPISPALYMMRTSDLTSTVLAEGNYTALHLTSNYLYFQKYGDPTVTYHAMLGSLDYSVFEAAQRVAMAATN
ncbi:MAG: DUF5050 domain-containing protein [Lachnospiraceae bacterium]|jgi:hypothetical protein|nr:DUF5050 domain-containing protein [Lachnospiraceae bacterium]